MKRKILAALLSGVMVLSLAACTSGTSSSEGGGDGEGSSESEEASGALTSFESDKEDGFVVGFSNGYWGNTWRAQMVEDFEKRAEEYKAEGVLSDYM